MRLYEFAPSPDRDDNDKMPDQLLVLANRWWNAAEKQPQIEHVLNSLGWSIQQVESEDDAVQLQHRDGTTYFISADDFDPELFEIARIPQSELDGWGDKDTLEPMTTLPKDRKPLPGGSGFTYAVNRDDPEFMEIMIFDGDTLAAELDLFATLDPLKTWRVETIITDPDYRGKGMGKALYGIALSILKLTIEAGETQTKFGQAMWLMLDSIPGVEVLGYAMARTPEYRARPGDKVADQNDTWTRYTFPVEPGKRSMRSTRPGTGIYSSQYVSMIAKWTGR
jgi:GNAT superfamily N-acetyltransferase